MGVAQEKSSRHRNRRPDRRNVRRQQLVLTVSSLTVWLTFGQGNRQNDAADRHLLLGPDTSRSRTETRERSYTAAIHPMIMVKRR